MTGALKVYSGRNRPDLAPVYRCVGRGRLTHPLLHTPPLDDSRNVCNVWPPGGDYGVGAGAQKVEQGSSVSRTGARRSTLSGGAFCTRFGILIIARLLLLILSFGSAANRQFVVVIARLRVRALGCHR